MSRAKKLQILVVGAITALLVLAVGAYAWDAAADDRIADGVSVGGVAVGGLTPDEARKRIKHDLVEPLNHPVKADFQGNGYKLSPKELDVRADVGQMVDDALAASDEGGILGRTWRRVSGGEVDHDVKPRVAYDEKAVEEFVAEVAADIDREPRDASVEASATSVEPVPSKAGIKVRDGELRAAVVREVDAPGANDEVAVEVERVQPEVTTKELAAQYPHYITIDRGSFTLRHYENLKLAGEYTIAVGQIGYDTPAGVYHIQNKAVNPSWTVPDSDWTGDLAGQVIPPGPDNPLKARWMGIYDGAGIHGTDDVGSLGTAASHGCIRMAVTDVIALYDKIPTGTPVYIG